MHKNENGFGVIEVLLILVIIIAVAGSGMIVYERSRKSNSTEGVSTGESASKLSIEPIMRGVQYKMLDATPGSTCAKDRNVCYHGTTYFLKMQRPVYKDFETVTTNLIHDKWLDDEGATFDSQLEKWRTLDLERNGQTQADNIGYWGLLNFGADATIYRDNIGADFVAFDKSMVVESDYPYYYLDSSLSVGPSYDYDKLLSQINDDAYILAVTVGEGEPADFN